MQLKPKIGLALGSGGWRGLAHIGVIKSLVKHGYSISAIAGSSAGALIGSLYALNQDIEAVEAEFNRLNYQHLLPVLADPSIKLGLIGGNKTIDLFRKYYHHHTIEELQLPFKAIATDILTSQPVILDSGDLAFAVRASSSIPVLFEPVAFQDKLLIDGGVSNPVPIDIVKTMDVDIVIAVNLYASGFPLTSKLSRMDLVSAATEAMLNQLSLSQANQADIFLNPTLAKFGSINLTKFLNNQRAIDQGEKAMDEAMPALQLLLS